VPPAPQAGDTVQINGTCIVNAAISGGSGQIDAYLYGVDVFEQPVNTCGQTAIDVLGVATGTLNAMPCPLAAGGTGRFSFTMQIPDEAQGLGLLNITVQAKDQASSPAFCVNLSVTL
jgi:hypothetical protein